MPFSVDWPLGAQIRLTGDARTMSCGAGFESTALAASCSAPTMTDWKKSCTQCFEDESCTYPELGSRDRSLSSVLITRDAGCLSCCCPCCQVGKNAEAIGLGGFCACCCAAYCFTICTGTYVRFKVRIPCAPFFSPTPLMVTTRCARSTTSPSLPA